MHKELLALIEIRDPSGARRLMDDHVKMIRARRVTEHGKAAAAAVRPRESGDPEPHIGSQHAGPGFPLARERTEIAGRRRAMTIDTRLLLNSKEEKMAKDKFIIEPHFRLQEWVAEEKGYFKDEGLDYVFREMVQKTDGKHHDKGDRVGAMQSFEAGRDFNVSCACHWTVGVAASKGKGKLYGEVYSVSPSGIFVPPDSAVKKPEDLAGVPISVGYQSGSHYATIQALEPYMPADKINLNFADGMLFARLDNLLERQGAGLHAVQRAVLHGRAARLPQNPRQHLHDRHHDQRRSRP